MAGVSPVEAAKVPAFQINSTKFYIFVVTLSMNDRIEFLEKIKQRFKRIFSWNKYRFEIETQPKYFNYKLIFNGIFSINNSSVIKDGAYVINLNDKKSKGTH